MFCGNMIRKKITDTGKIIILRSALKMLAGSHGG